MKNKILDQLCDCGSIKSYEYENVSEDGIVGDNSSYRNTERLILNFLNGTSLTIDSFCSGSLEDTSFDFKFENAKSCDELVLTEDLRKYPSFVKTEEDKKRFMETLKKMPSEEDFAAFATKPTQEWLDQRAKLKEN